MNKLFIILFLFAGTNSVGQTAISKISYILVDTTKNPGSDTALRVIYAYKKKPERHPAIFINGKFFAEQLINSLDPKKIENVEVVKGDTLINNIQYFGQIQIKIKGDYIYNPKTISLTELKNKYTDLNGKPVIFMIDGNIVNADYDNYVIDENYILTIIVDKFQNAKESIDLGIIKLLTKSEDNIKKRKQIMLRGAEVTRAVPL